MHRSAKKQMGGEKRLKTYSSTAFVGRKKRGKRKEKFDLLRGGLKTRKRRGVLKTFTKRVGLKGEGKGRLAPSHSSKEGKERNVSLSKKGEDDLGVSTPSRTFGTTGREGKGEATSRQCHD